ncbi:MAG TPA: TIGR00730 family Rossman fold protein [Stellaceae bacterium]|nr:TIGR00730 family Rossman fold protein [Stellaceae bacterium]
MRQSAWQIGRLCVYCGSSQGADPRYRAAARELGAGVAARGIELIYGGGRNGLMGAAADAALAGGGRVTGIIPVHLEHREAAHRGLSDLVVVTDMHQRKRVMAERADAFAVLPGGVGTLDETIEILSWRQLGLHDKPVIVIDIAGYWSPLAELFDHIVASRFAAPLVPRLVSFVPDVAGLFAALSGDGRHFHETGG